MTVTQGRNTAMSNTRLKLRRAWGSAATALAALLLASTASAQLLPGDILVIDRDAGTNSQGALFRVDPVTGARTLVSDFGIGDNPGREPLGVAVEASGQILVTDTLAGTNVRGALFRVDPVTGARTILNDFGAGDNPGLCPADIAVETSGQILVVDVCTGASGQGALFRVDPVTGARTIVSDFGAGDNAGGPTGVAVETSGQILLIDPFADVLFRVDPVTGARTVVSVFGAGDPGVGPAGVAVEASGQILVIDPLAGTNFHGALFRVDPVTGARTVVSDFGAGDPPGRGLFDVAVEASGQILVSDSGGRPSVQGALFRVDPVTGARTVVSDFGVGDEPVGIAIVPSVPAPSLTIDDVIALFDQAVASGTLRGTGRDQVARLRLSGVRFALLSVRYVLERGHRILACALLEGVANRTDGNSLPPDFVQGPAAPDLFEAIRSLQGRLGCTY
jgi:sugar lactone lactonase YvrE